MINYKNAGVNIEAGNEIVRRIKDPVKKTFDAQVLTNLGGFAGLYDLKQIINDYHEPVLVQSMDGLGTKPMIANMMQRFDTLGHDLLSATANDILVCGAKPLTLLDYIGSDHLDPDQVVTIIEGLSQACREQHVSLIGGETAEMPGVYQKQEIDIVGIITGVVEKDKIINGHSIEPGDKILGFASSGLHTNGYSLARKLCFDANDFKPHHTVSALNQTIGDALLAPHINYTQPVLELLHNFSIKGMAHITGGGFLDNIPRVLPSGCSVEIEQGSWPCPPLFTWLIELGNISQEEAFRTFNMGIGYILITEPEAAAEIERFIKTHFTSFKLYEIGQVIKGENKVILK